MKTLLLMRHAKSAWTAASRTDHDRPIDERGGRAAGVVGSWLTHTDQVPDRVLCSTATRARQTLERVAESGGWDCPIDFDDTIYGAVPAALIAAARALDDDIAAAMIVGHEPGMSMTASMLLGEASLRFATAAVARLELDIERWSALEPGTARLVFFLPPRLLD